jgi:glycosyltransferase involved in cell wall biosynthesis
MSDALRVLHVSDYEHAGGAELVARTLVRVQCELGHRSVLCAARATPDTNPWKLERFANPRVHRRLRALLAREQPDVVHLHNTYHSVSPLGEHAIVRYLDERRRAGKPACLVASAHDYANVFPSPTAQVFDAAGHPTDLSFDELPLKLSDLFGRRWDRRGWLASTARTAQFVIRRSLVGLIGRFDLVVCGSELSADAFRQVGARTVTIPLFADVDHALAVRPRPPGSGVRALYIGRLDDLKGVDRLLWNWPEADGHQLRIVGRGPAEPELRRIVASRALGSVEFIGEVDRTGVTEQLRDADVVIAPTVWRETSGLSVLEAAALDLPVIVPAGTALAEVSTRSGAGIVLDAFTEADLRKALAQVRDSPRPASRHTIASPRAYGEQVTDWYQRLLGEMRT